MRTKASIESSVATQEEHISLCETLDRVLNKGVYLTGDIVISVAEVDLIYLGLKLMLSSAESSHSWGCFRGENIPAREDTP